MKNESGESKRNVTCGICNQTGRRDNMRRNHFPRKHPGVNYFEKGDKIVKAAKAFFTLKERNEIFNDEPNVDIDDESDADGDDEIDADGDDEIDVVAGAPNNANMNVDDEEEEVVNKHEDFY